MENNLFKRGLVIGIIFLFFGVGISTSFSAQFNNNISKINSNLIDNKTFEFIVTEFKADGTKEDTIVEMSYEQAKNFVKDLKEIKSQEEKLSLFKNYGFITESVTLEQLRVGMEKKAEINGLNEELLKKFGNNLFLKYNLKCSVEGENFGFIRLLLGSSAVTRILNFFLMALFDIYFFIPSIDLLNNQIGFLDVIVKNGRLQDFDFTGWGITVMAGFVGYYIHCIPLFIFSPILTISDCWFGSAAFVGVFGKYQQFP